LGLGGQRHAPAALPQEREAVPIVQEAGWAPGPVWTVAEKILPFLGGRCFMDLVGLLGYLFVCLVVCLFVRSLARRHKIIELPLTWPLPTI
jgi:hypothetical protein